jgi:dihydropteroate synthase
LQRLGVPLLVGLSRKRLLGSLTGRSTDRRLHAGIAAAVLAVERGARIVRTHDVTETVDAMRVFQAVVEAS